MIAWQDWQQWPATWGQLGSRLFSRAGQKQKLVVGVNLVLILSLSYSLADLSWSLMPAAKSVPAPLAHKSKLNTSQRQPQQNLNIARWQLFGKYAADPVRAAVKVENIPETRLKLVLRGVFAGGEGAASGAIIAAPTGKQLYYSLGADLPGGAVLEEVHARHIVLLRNGQLETLHLPRDKIAGKAGGIATVKSDRLSGRRHTGRPLQERSLREYRDTLLKDPQQLADVFKARPYRKNGIKGFQINPGRDKALFMNLGLEPNDVITSVNGIQLDNPARGLSVLQTLKEEGPVIVEIMRNGVPQMLSIDVNQ